MAMKTASPWWFSALFALGLVALFVGERPFDHISSVRVLASGGGALLILGVTGLRLWTMLATRGDRRTVERMLLFAQLGVLFGLLLYVTTTQWGMEVLGVDDLEGKSLTRYMTPMTVLYGIVLLASLVPMLLIELSLGVARRTEFKPKRMVESDVDQEIVESFRVREMANAGLTIGLAAALLLVTCNIAQQRNIRRDVSYFKTSSPGESTINIVKSVSQPVTVHLFFPSVNQVKNEIRGYFDALAEATGNVAIEEHDFLLDAALVKELRVPREGTVVVAYNGKTHNESFTFDPEKARKGRARDELRELDRKINSALLRVIKEKRNVYLTVGHGELNDPDSDWVKMGVQVNELKRRIREQNYEVKELSVANGLGTEIPDDAAMILMLGPKTTLMDEEAASIERYLDRGGRLMVALDPLSDAGLGALGERLGVTFDNTMIVDPQNFLPGRQPSRADRRFIKTNRVSAHGAVTTLSGAPARYGAAFLGTGSFEHLEIDEARKSKITRLPIIRAMQTAFADKNGDFAFNEGTEEIKQYNLVMAIEEPSSVPEGADGSHEGMRAILFGDMELFSDPFQQRMPTAVVIFADVLRWLGGEEALAGEIVSEKDVVIEHTRNEDEVWFYSTIVGAPAVVLGFGLWFGWWRRQRTKRRAS